RSRSRITMSYLLSYISKMLCIKTPSSEEAAAKQPAAGEECCVCLSRIRAGEATRRLPCEHAFHRDCVDRWLALCKRTCPLCRVYVADGNGRQAAAKHAGEGALADDLVIWFSTMLVPGF
uniref:RING-type E3 ubiquitin transferase n=2 Tax=Aegilops tauschii TaxID=37682 RepID=A0A453AFX2_AEGTS